MMRERFAALVVPAFLGGLALILGKLGASAAGPVTADPVQLLTPEPVGGPFPVAPPPVDGFADGLTDPPTPILRMKMRVPETAAIGQELTYRIRI